MVNFAGFIEKRSTIRSHGTRWLSDVYCIFFVIVSQRFSFLILKVISLLLLFYKSWIYWLACYSLGPHSAVGVKGEKKSVRAKKTGVRSQLSGGLRRGKPPLCFFSLLHPFFASPLPPPSLRSPAWFHPRLVKILSRFSFLVVGDFLQVKCLLDLVNHQSDSFQVTSMIYRVIHMIHQQRIEYLPGRWVVTYRSWPARVRLCLFFWQKKLAGCLIKRSANFFVPIPLTTFSSESVRLQIPRGNKFCAKWINSARWKRKRKQLTFRGTTTAGVVKCCVTVKFKKGICSTFTGKEKHLL